MVTAKKKARLALTALAQVRISPRAASLLRKRAKSALRTQAGYLRALIYRDLGLADVEE